MHLTRGAGPPEGGARSVRAGPQRQVAQAVFHSHSQQSTSSTFSHGLAQAPGSVPKHSEEIIPQSGIN